MLPSTLCLGLHLALASVVTCAVFAVDSVSCPRSDGTYDAIVAAVERTIATAERVSILLRRTDKLAPESRDKIRMILGNPDDDKALLPTVQALDRIADLLWHGAPADSAQWKAARTPTDVQFHCDLRHFEPAEPKDNPEYKWEDKVRALYWKDESWIHAFRNMEDKTKYAVTLADPVGLEPEHQEVTTITFHPAYLQAHRANGFSTLSLDQVAKASSGFLKEQLKSLPDYLVPYDVLLTSLIETVIMHELMHTPLGPPHRGRPADGNEVYPWQLIVKTPNDVNAENIMKFVYAVVIMEDFSHDVLDDGNLVRYFREDK